MPGSSSSSFDRGTAAHTLGKEQHLAHMPWQPLSIPCAAADAWHCCGQSQLGAAVKALAKLADRTLQLLRADASASQRLAAQQEDPALVSFTNIRHLAAVAVHTGQQGKNSESLVQHAAVQLVIVSQSVYACTQAPTHGHSGGLHDLPCMSGPTACKAGVVLACAD